MQDEVIMIDGIVIHQPDKDLQHSFVTTYSEDSVRVQSGVGHFTPLFTAEQESYTATNIPAEKVSEILQLVIQRNFTLHYFSPYYGCWRDDTFYVGKGDCKIGTLKENEEKFSSLSFNMTGINPVKPARK